jgi:ferredoxin
MNGTNLQRQQCLETWISCESLLSHLAAAEVKGIGHVMKIVDECAHICMETWQAIKSSSAEASLLSLLCIGICEECADVCEQQPCLQMKQCAKACRTCARHFTQLKLAVAYN